MGLFLHYEFESSLSPDEFQERVIGPIQEALRRECLGTILDPDPSDDDVGNDHYEIAMEVTDTKRAMDVVAAVLDAEDGTSVELSN